MDTAIDGGSNASVRLGLGKGILTDPADFDHWDAGIAAMFEGNQL